jgi:glutathione S-transferase
MLRLYIANRNYSSWSLRPWVLLKQLGIPFEEALLPFGSGDGPSPFKAISPSGKVPCLVDGATTVWDSLAITEYVAEQHARVWPADRVARAWARSASAEMHSGFGQVRSLCSMNCGVRIRLHQWPAPLLDEWRRVDALWGEGLARFGGPYLAGPHFTAADAFFAPVVFRAQTYAAPLASVAQDYADRMRALPAMQAWYDLALAEPWRDAEHEREVMSAGVCTADLRRPLPASP